MSRGGQSLLGGAEVSSLIGAWKTIVGSGAADPFRDILGADFRYENSQPHHRHHHHHHHRENFGGGYTPPPMAMAPVAAFVPNYPGEQVWMREGHRGYEGRGRGRHATVSIRGEEGSALERAFGVRNELVDRPGPTRADRVILPMSSGVNILPNTSAQITSRPQDVAFRPERIVIGQAGTDKGAADWIVNDVKVGNKSQFSQSGDVPGDLFGATTIDSYVSFATVQTAMDFVMLVTYVGTSESGAPFYCAVLGTAAV